MITTVNYSVPEEIKKAFNQTFSHENKSQIIAHLMQQAVEEANMQQRRVKVIEKILQLRSHQKPISHQKIQRALKAGRP